METNFCIQIEIQFQRNELNDLHFCTLCIRISCFFRNSQCTDLERRLHELESDEHSEEDFADILVREAISINSNVKEESVRSAIDEGGLSWAVVEDLRKEDVVERLRVIQNLDESQCNELFDKMDGMVPVERDTKRRNCIIGLSWITRCMYSHYSVSMCSQ